MDEGVRRQQVDFKGEKWSAPLKHEFGSRRNMLSAYMHMAESKTLIRGLYAGNTSANGIGSGIQNGDTEAVQHFQQHNNWL